MKKLRKVSFILIITSIMILMCARVYANDITDGIKSVEVTDEFKQYLNLSEEERAKLIVPRAYTVIDAGEMSKNPLHIARLYGAASETKYSLKDVIPNNMVIKDQQNTDICWAFAALASLESNLALTKDASKTYDFSERHMDYSTSRNFANNITNPFGFARSPATSGNFEVALSYLTNGSGAIDESQMPFENNGNTIDISQIQNKTVTSEVYDTVTFPSYEVTSDTTAIKNQIKEHIKSYGAVVASIYIDENSTNMQYTNRTTGAVYCNDSSKPINHQCAIIGWDDTYAVSNFNQSPRPSNPGAWVIKNSWGTEIGNNGFLYLSYEDVNAYKFLYGIIKSENATDYENIYQYNPFGANGELNFSSSKVYAANVFEKKTTGKEYITQVSLHLSETSTCKVYVNPNGLSKAKADLQEVQLQSGTSETLGAGYHTLEFARPIEITGSNFVVVVEMQGARENAFKLPIEARFTDEEHKIYSNVTIENSKCFVTYGSSFDRNAWIDLSKLEEESANGQNVDTTIKAFTVSHIVDDSLNRIEITNQPTKTSYFVGEDFNKSGMVVTAYYNNDTSKVIDNYTITNGTSLKNGQTSVTISFENKTATQNITVQENTVESIRIVTPPTNTEYKAGYDFDKTGMVVEATFKDETKKNITDYTITNGTNLKSTQTYVIISYANKTVNQEITVSENALEQLRIITPPSKIKYFIGEDFDKTGMVVIADYEDGYQKEVTDYTIENRTSLKKDQNNVTIKYENQTVNQPITVVERPTNSNLDNIKSTVKKIDTYVFSDQNKEDYIVLEIEVSGIENSSNNEKLEYYYYLSKNQNESNIQNWTKINGTLDDGKLQFKISTKDIPNYNEIKDADDIYLYIKEVAISNNAESTAVSKAMKLEAESGTNLEINVDEKKVVDQKVAEIQKNNGSTGASSQGSTVKGDQTVAKASELPKAGVKTIFISIIICGVLGIVLYIRYKKLSKYVK